MNENRAGIDVLKVQGRMVLGYGLIPKMPMQDQRITIEAKAIYSYFCSYAGAGTTAFPSRGKILRDLKIGEDRYYKHFNLLKKYGYITVEQNTDNKGKFRNNIYTLVEMIEPYPENKGTDPYPYIPGTKNKGTKNNTVKSNTLENDILKDNGILNNDLKNRDLKNNNTIILSNPILSVYPEKTETEKTDPTKYNTSYTPEKTETKKTDSIRRDTSKIESVKKEGFSNIRATQSVKHFENPVRYDYNIVSEIIKKNLEYENLIAHYTVRQEILDEIVHVIVSTIVSEYKDGYISMGEARVPAEAVKSVFFKLNMLDIEYFIDCFNRQTKPVIKLTPYIRTSLFRNYGTLKHHYDNRVCVDMPHLADPKI